nr:immunoglobulin heavy chain junction region [Macaca mulatta]MOW77656.1 immunoglobulin heavy chain junction region [Macaca mulatta]MOW78691.1 immunoglobulin heavy chain junction region [Macaca mulatta]MOW80929.1 immunoglobulin heavy chain junction region [Macaca mulatta]MOW81363.1 immunoglobulin heavy chain junction region [Macaca mulatta]
CARDQDGHSFSFDYW